jgi:hypothetical protein
MDPKPVAASRSTQTLSPTQLTELLRLLKGAQTVELKLSVPDVGLRSAVTSLGMDPLDAELRQVCFFDTPDLALNRHGLVVRVRRIQRKPGDTVVKQRPVDPETLPAKLRKSEGFGVEVDAMPGGFICSGRMKAQVKDSSIRDTWAGQRQLRKLFTKQQRAFYASVAPDGLTMDGLSMLGPVNVLKLKFVPVDFGRTLVAELWNYPNGSRILELSTKCLPGEAFEVAAETRAFLGGHGVDLSAAQQTKTKAALRFFAKELASQPGDGPPAEPNRSARTP